MRCLNWINAVCPLVIEFSLCSNLDENFADINFVVCFFGSLGAEETITV